MRECRVRENTYIVIILMKRNILNIFVGTLHNQVILCKQLRFIYTIFTFALNFF